MDQTTLDPITHLQEKIVVVTGGGGSIGSELCHRIVEAGADKLRIVSLTESGLYSICRKLQKLDSPTIVVPVLGSVTNQPLMAEACRGADIVIHAAAHKHVPICEQNPLEAMHNNILGTYSMASAARSEGVSQFMLVSTDKAVRPVSVMGRTKRVAELIVRRFEPGFTTVRFGNVRDSAGSVIPLWREQIRSGETVTVTDPNCTRYFMTIPEACDLILNTLAMRPMRGTFVFDMGEPIKISDLLAEIGMGFEFKVKEIGLRQGEKLHEELHHGGELHSTAHDKIWRVEEAIQLPHHSELFDLLSAIRCRAEGHALHLLELVAP